jgi:hypothetical protein
MRFKNDLAARGADRFAHRPCDLFGTRFAQAIASGPRRIGATVLWMSVINTVASATRFFIHGSVPFLAGATIHLPWRRFAAATALDSCWRLPRILAPSFGRKQPFAPGDHRYTDVKTERIECAIADDEAFLAAHPMRHNNSEAMTRRREFKEAMRRRIRDVAASHDLSDEEIKPALTLKHQEIARFSEQHGINIEWLLGKLLGKWRTPDGWGGSQIRNRQAMTRWRGGLRSALSICSVGELSANAKAIENCLRR